MEKQIPKSILLFISVLTSLFCIIVSVLEQLTYKGIIRIEYYGIFGYYIKTNIFLINLFYCITGIILIIIFIIKNRIKFIKEYFLLIPSILISILLIIIMIITILNNQSFGMEFPILLFTIGSLSFLFYYINQNYKTIILIILCILFPINIFISLLDFLGMMGI